MEVLHFRVARGHKISWGPQTSFCPITCVDWILIRLEIILRWRPSVEPTVYCKDSSFFTTPETAFQCGHLSSNNLPLFFPQYVSVSFTTWLKTQIIVAPLLINLDSLWLLFLFTSFQNLHGGCAMLICSQLFAAF